MELWSSGPQPVTAIIGVPPLTLSIDIALLLIDVSVNASLLRNYIKLNFNMLTDKNVGSDEQGNKVPFSKQGGEFSYNLGDC
jgi:hypothetical protein